MTDVPVSPDFVRAAGAVIWRGDESAPEVALVHRPKYDDWTIPKGKLCHGEHVIAAAVREVGEETRLPVALGRWLGSVHYGKDGWAKRVDYWAARAQDGNAVFSPNEEVDRVSWLPLEQARQALTFERDIAVLREFAAKPAATVPLVLVRHGRLSGSGDDWKGKKKARPLDGIGLSQARTLATVLAAYRPVTLIGAPGERCTQTLEPYATPNRLTIRQEKLFTKKHFHLPGALRVVRGTMALMEPAAICGYRESLEQVIPEACRGRYDGEVPLRLYKGTFVVLHHTHDRVVSVERYIL